MGCVGSKEQDSKPPVHYAPPKTNTSQVPEHQQLAQQPSQHRISVSSGIGSHNGSISYNQGLPPIPSPVPEDDGSLFIARYAYQARTSEDLSFEKGEKLKVTFFFQFFAICSY